MCPIELTRDNHFRTMGIAAIDQAAKVLPGTKPLATFRLARR
jgi:hypothetical protein